jgi:pimeloyl-ACP methyl ester carboxylesterase
MMRAMGRWLLRIFVGVVALLALVLVWQWRADLPLPLLEQHWATGASRFVEVDGMRVHYRDEGQGPLVVLLPGTGASLHTWDAWTTGLVGGGRRVVRLDLPAFGLTGPNPSNDYRISAYVTFLEHFAAKLGLLRFALGGNSLGGGIAWEYAVAHPERVEALLLVDAGGYPRAEPPPLAFRLGRYPALAWLMAHLDPRPLVAKTLRQAYGDPAKVTPELIQRYWELSLRPGNRAAFGARTGTPWEDHTAALHGLKVPVLVQWGRLDHVIPVADADKFKRDVPGAQLRIYDALGHVPMEEDGPRTVADARAFLDALPRTPSPPM